MSKQEKLEACWCCGENQTKIVVREHLNRQRLFDAWVQCRCTARGPESGLYVTRELAEAGATKKWNRRTPTEDAGGEEKQSDLTEKGNMICSRCTAVTHRRYIGTPSLVCWKCGWPMKPTAQEDKGEKDLVGSLQDAIRLRNYHAEMISDQKKEIASLQAKLAEKEKNEKYWLEQHGIEVEKRGEAEHQLDLARGDKADAFESLERELAEKEKRIEELEGSPTLNMARSMLKSTKMLQDFILGVKRGERVLYAGPGYYVQSANSYEEKEAKLKSAGAVVIAARAVWALLKDDITPGPTAVNLEAALSAHDKGEARAGGEALPGGGGNGCLNKAR